MLYVLFFYSSVVLFNSINGEDDWQVDIEHTLGGEEYTPRAKLLLSRDRFGDDSWTGSIIWQTTPDDQQWDSLVKAAGQGRRYFIRTTSTKSSKEYIFSTTDYCYLVRSGLNDVLSVAIDPSKQRIRAISVQPMVVPPVPQCSLSDPQLMSPSIYNTTVRVVNVVQGPSPETQAYLQKIEKEKQERQRGEDPDNRSFLQKYWMYIVPVVIFFMISNAINPEQPQQAAR